MSNASKAFYNTKAIKESINKRLDTLKDGRKIKFAIEKFSRQRKRDQKHQPDYHNQAEKEVFETVRNFEEVYKKNKEENNEKKRENELFDKVYRNVEKQHKELFDKETTKAYGSEEKTLFDPTPTLLQNDKIINYYTLIEDKTLYSKEKKFLDKMKFQCEDRNFRIHNNAGYHSTRNALKTSSIKYIGLIDGIKKDSNTKLVLVGKNMELQQNISKALSQTLGLDPAKSYSTGFYEGDNPVVKKQQSLNGGDSKLSTGTNFFGRNGGLMKKISTNMSVDLRGKDADMINELEETQTPHKIELKKSGFKNLFNSTGTSFSKNKTESKILFSPLKEVEVDLNKNAFENVIEEENLKKEKKEKKPKIKFNKLKTGMNREIRMSMLNSHFDGLTLQTTDSKEPNQNTIKKHLSIMSLHLEERKSIRKQEKENEKIKNFPSLRMSSLNNIDFMGSSVIAPTADERKDTSSPRGEYYIAWDEIFNPHLQSARPLHTSSMEKKPLTSLKAKRSSITNPLQNNQHSFRGSILSRSSRKTHCSHKEDLRVKINLETPSVTEEIEYITTEPIKHPQSTGKNKRQTIATGTLTGCLPNAKNINTFSDLISQSKTPKTDIKSNDQRKNYLEALRKKYTKKDSSIKMVLDVVQPPPKNSIEERMKKLSDLYEKAAQAYNKDEIIHNIKEYLEKYNPRSKYLRPKIKIEPVDVLNYFIELKNIVSNLDITKIELYQQFMSNDLAMEDAFKRDLILIEKLDERMHKIGVNLVRNINSFPDVI